VQSVADSKNYAGEIKKAREEGTIEAADLDTIVHPNTYFKRSYLLKSGQKPTEVVDYRDEMEM